MKLIDITAMHKAGTPQASLVVMTRVIGKARTPSHLLCCLSIVLSRNSHSATLISTIFIHHFRYYAAHAVSGAGANIVPPLCTFDRIDLDSSGVAFSCAESLPKYLAWECERGYDIHSLALEGVCTELLS